MAYVPRWSIVRTIRQQYLAEHTFFVCMYANDIGVWLGLAMDEMGKLLQMALWHDMEEIFSGDLPGPCKRAGMDGFRQKWDDKLRHWLTKVFGNMGDRDGSTPRAKWRIPEEAFDAIIKLADMIDECCEMGTEIQMGNRTVDRIFADSLQRVKAAISGVRKHFPYQQSDWHRLESRVIQCCLSSRDGESRSTRIFESL